MDMEMLKDVVYGGDVRVKCRHYDCKFELYGRCCNAAVLEAAYDEAGSICLVDECYMYAPAKINIMEEGVYESR